MDNPCYNAPTRFCDQNADGEQPEVRLRHTRGPARRPAASPLWGPPSRARARVKKGSARSARPRWDTGHTRGSQGGCAGRGSPPPTTPFTSRRGCVGESRRCVRPLAARAFFRIQKSSTARDRGAAQRPLAPVEGLAKCRLGIGPTAWAGPLGPAEVPPASPRSPKTVLLDSRWASRPPRRGARHRRARSCTSSPPGRRCGRSTSSSSNPPPPESRCATTRTILPSLTDHPRCRRLLRLQDNGRHPQGTPRRTPPSRRPSRWNGHVDVEQGRAASVPHGRRRRYAALRTFRRAFSSRRRA